MRSLSLYDNNALTPQNPVIQIIASAGVSWVDITNLLNTTYGYDGITYPLVDSSSSMSAVRGILNLAEPGRWDLACNVALCSCNQLSCSCILDSTGTYSNYNTCLSACCPTIVYGCTNPSAINYNPTVNFDDNSCIFCNNVPGTTFVTALSLIHI